MSAAAARVCVVCGEPIRWGRRDRVTCSPACRQRRSRRQRGLRPHGVEQQTAGRAVSAPGARQP
jgi:hypothetical protein